MKKSNDCAYNADIECKSVCRDCQWCGWNPIVKKQRMRQIIQTKSYKQNRQLDLGTIG